MKSLLITGVTLLFISAFLFYFSTGYRFDEITPSHFMGVLGGIGIGLIIGGVVGYVSKGSSVKAEKRINKIAERKVRNRKTSGWIGAPTSTNESRDTKTKSVELIQRIFYVFWILF